MMLWWIFELGEVGMVMINNVVSFGVGGFELVYFILVCLFVMK